MLLDELLDKLCQIDLAKDSIYMPEQTVKKIRALEPKDTYYINRIISTIENQKVHSFPRMMLSCALRDLLMDETQVKRIWQMIDDQSYGYGIREYLVESLNAVVVSKHLFTIERLYQRFNQRTGIEQKIQAGKLLLADESYGDEVSQWLFDFAVDDSLPDVIEERNTTALKLECCSALTSSEKFIQKGKQAIFHLLTQCSFMKCIHDVRWDEVTSTFLKMPLDDDDVEMIIQLAKDKQLISYHRIHFLKLLPEIETEVDIVTSLIDMLAMDNETFNAFNENVLEVLSSFEITEKHQKYAVALRKKESVSWKAKKWLRKLKSQ